MKKWKEIPKLHVEGSYIADYQETIHIRRHASHYGLASFCDQAIAVNKREFAEGAAALGKIESAALVKSKASDPIILALANKSGAAVYLETAPIDKAAKQPEWPQEPAPCHQLANLPADYLRRASRAVAHAMGKDPWRQRGIHFRTKQERPEHLIIIAEATNGRSAMQYLEKWEGAPFKALLPTNALKECLKEQSAVHIYPHGRIVCGSADMVLPKLKRGDDPLWSFQDIDKVMPEHRGGVIVDGPALTAALKSILRFSGNPTGGALAVLIPDGDTLQIKHTSTNDRIDLRIALLGSLEGRNWADGARIGYDARLLLNITRRFKGAMALCAQNGFDPLYAQSETERHVLMPMRL